MFAVSQIGVLTLTLKWIEIFSYPRVSYNLPKFCSNATWNTSGASLPIVDTRNPTFSQPTNIFVKRNNILYACCHVIQKKWAIVWYDSVKKSSGDMGYYKIKNVPIPNSIFIATNGDIYIAGGTDIFIYPWRQQSWILKKRSIKLDNKKPCFGLFIDTDGTIYCSVKDSNKVIKKSLSRNTNWQSAAGTGEAGPELDMLSEPHGIFVDISFNLYVADCGNNRIQLFKPEDKNGTTVLNSAVIIGDCTLQCPTAVILDADSNLYIADCHRHRIVFVTSSFNEYRCLVGCSGVIGSDRAHLSNPTSISFDQFGNIFVSDTGNSRLQQFALTTEYCVETSTQEIPATDDPSSFPFLSYTGDNDTFYSGDDDNTNSSESNDIESIMSQEPSISSLITTVTTTSSLSTSSPSPPIDKPPPIHFVPPNCSNSSSIGSSCNISTQPCDIQKPCKNSGYCTNDPTHPKGYSCACRSGFNGTNCESDIRPCQLNTCLHGGTCIEVNNTHFFCNCTEGRTGIHCDILIDYYHNVTCLNRGICRSLLLDYKCECISDSISGRHCENVATSLIVRQYVSKTFGYIAIIAISLVIGFVVIMDILKYVLGIDPVREVRDQIRRQRLSPQKNDRGRREP